MQSIKVQELRKLFMHSDTDELIVDVRDKSEFDAKHIKGAKNLSLSTIKNHIDMLESVKTVYVHCRSGRRSAIAYQILTNAGVNVINIEGGISAWEHAGFNVEKSKRNVISIKRQVMIADGILVLIGVVLGIYVNEWWYFLSGFVGVGLIFSGITSLCLMAHILNRMPWNKT